MNKAEFCKLIDAALTRSIDALGFRRTAAGNWTRRRDDDFNVIWIQRSHGGDKYCVSLGVHYSFVPKSGSLDLPMDGIEQPECDFKFRLTTDPAAGDQWWLPSEHSASEIADLIATRALPTFDHYRLSGRIRSITPGDGVSSDPLLKSLTEVGALLLLARVHEHLGNRDVAIAFARRGIPLCGQVRSAKAWMMEILKRLEAAP